MKRGRSPFNFNRIIELGLDHLDSHPRLETTVLYTLTTFKPRTWDSLVEVEKGKKEEKRKEWMVETPFQTQCPWVHG